MIKEHYWRQRAEEYSSFKWAKDSEYIKFFLNFMCFSDEDLVLDAGIGTGLISDQLSQFVKTIIGVDTSLDMLNQCSRNGNVILMKEDIRDLPFMDESFDKIIIRNVLHHIVKENQKAVDECYRVLKKKGRILIGERVPPADEVKEEYNKIFQLKNDERIIFTEQGLIQVLMNSGFKIVVSEDYWIRNLSVKNWLSKSTLPTEIQDKIYSLHVNGSRELKEAYNMKIFADDCLIDIKNVVIKGKK